MAISDVLRVQGDYIIQAPNGNITLNPGISFTNLDGNTATTGVVVVEGNLEVRGTTTTIESTTATIRDNIIVLNSGQTGSDTITNGSAGFWVDRGDNAAIGTRASLEFEDAYTWTPYFGFAGTKPKGSWNFVNSNKGAAIKVNAIRLGSSPQLAKGTGQLGIQTLSLFGNENQFAILSVSGTHNYEDNIDSIQDEDAIPNLRWVKRYVLNAASTPPNVRKLTQLNSSVLLTDNGVDAPDVKINLGGPNVQYTFKSNGELRIDGQNASMSILDNSFTAVATTASSAPLILTASGNAGIALRSYAVLSNATQSAANWTAAKNNLGVGDTIVYSSSTSVVTGGGTNLFFVNSNNKVDPTTNTVIPEELVSRRRALVYAIVF